MFFNVIPVFVQMRIYRDIAHMNKTPKTHWNNYNTHHVKSLKMFHFRYINLRIQCVQTLGCCWS